MASTASTRLRSADRIAIIRNPPAKNCGERARGNFRNDEASYPNSSYVGIYWHNELGMARF